MRNNPIKNRVMSFGDICNILLKSTLFSGEVPITILPGSQDYKE